MFLTKIDNRNKRNRYIRSSNFSVGQKRERTREREKKEKYINTHKKVNKEKEKQKKDNKNYRSGVYTNIRKNATRRIFMDAKCTTIQHDRVRLKEFGLIYVRKEKGGKRLRFEE